MATAEELSKYGKACLAELLALLDRDHPGHSAAVVVYPKGCASTPGGCSVNWVVDDAATALRAAADVIDAEDGTPVTFQDRVLPWMIECFGEAILQDGQERNFRFMEEALELVQSLGMTKADVLRLVDYTYSREKGDPWQEAGGVMVCIAALCLAHRMDMHKAAEMELARNWTNSEAIRAKHRSKTVRSPLPGVAS